MLSERQKEQRQVKEHYEELEIEVVTFDAEDVILTSGDKDEGEGFPVFL